VILLSVFIFSKLFTMPEIAYFQKVCVKWISKMFMIIKQKNSGHCLERVLKDMMANFRCQLAWIKGYPDRWRKYCFWVYLWEVIFQKRLASESVDWIRKILLT
jgi:hypothetical protein